MTGFVGTILEAWDEIRIHRLRVALSLLAIGLAITVMTSALALGQQMAQATQELSEQQGGRSVTLMVDYSLTDQKNTPKMAEAFMEFVDRNEIEYASRITNPYGEFSARGGTRLDWVNIQAVDPAYATIHRIEPIRGTWFGGGDAERRAPAMVVNEALLRAVGVPVDLSVQPELTMRTYEGSELSFVAIGVVANEGEWDGPRAYILYDALIRSLPPTETQNFWTQFEMWLGPADAATAQSALTAELQPLVGEWGYVNVAPMFGGFGED
ncbi:MAG TPA: ABC transporter permease, partial [Actinomycetales bacterium]|nr:ABC transporter permease [Actinomycetales bacterium]